MNEVERFEMRLLFVGIVTSLIGISSVVVGWCADSSTPMAIGSLLVLFGLGSFMVWEQKIPLSKRTPLIRFFGRIRAYIADEEPID